MSKLQLQSPSENCSLISPLLLPFVHQWACTTCTSVSRTLMSCTCPAAGEQLSWQRRTTSLTWAGVYLSWASVSTVMSVASRKHLRHTLSDDADGKQQQQQKRKPRRKNRVCDHIWYWDYGPLLITYRDRDRCTSDKLIYAADSGNLHLLPLQQVVDIFMACKEQFTEAWMNLMLIAPSRGAGRWKYSLNSSSEKKNLFVCLTFSDRKLVFFSQKANSLAHKTLGLAGFQVVRKRTYLQIAKQRDSGEF